MPDQIFIADEEPSAVEERIAVLGAQAAKLEAVAVMGEWLTEQTDTTQKLAAEWMELRGSAFEFSERTDARGRTVYVCKSEHGHHESLQSQEHALFLLVDSHRVRAEDRPETRARLEALGFAPKEALGRCQAIGRDVARTYGRMPVADHDALVEAEIAKLEMPAPELPTPEERLK